MRALLFNDLETAERFRTAGVTVHVLSESEMSPLGILRRAIPLVETLGVDVVHTHDAKSNVVGALAGTWTRGVTLRTVHGAPEFQLRPTQLRKRVYALLDRRTTGLNGATVAVSEALGAALSEAGVPRVEVIPNGIDVDALVAEPRRPVDEGPFRVGMACRLVSLKRVDVLIRAIALMAPESGVEGVVFGAGPEEDGLRRLADSLGVADRVHFQGFAPAIQPALASMDALAIPSDHEGLPMVLLEAMALGTPVLAHSVGGIPAALGDGGILLDTQDPEAWAEEILTLRRQPHLRSDLSRRARARVVARHSIDATVRRYVGLYGRLCGNSPNP